MSNVGRGRGSGEGRIRQVDARGHRNYRVRANSVHGRYNTSREMVRSSDNWATFVFLIFGISLSIFGIWGDRILVILGGRPEPEVSGSFRHASPVFMWIMPCLAARIDPIRMTTIP